MPDISIQQAYALAFGAYASPNGNSSFTIQGSTGLPTNKTRLTGLLTTPNIDLKQIPSEQNEAPFNPVVTTFTLANSLSTVTEFASGGGGTIQLATAGELSAISEENRKLFVIEPIDGVSGSLNFSQDVYIASSSTSIIPDVFPTSSNITVTPAILGPINIARLRKTASGNIGITVQRSYNGESDFLSSNVISVSALPGLQFIIAGVQSSFNAFNSGGSNPPQFVPQTIVFYPTAEVDLWQDIAYEVGEYVRYFGNNYICDANTTAGSDQNPDDADFWSPVIEETFPNINATYTVANTSVNSIACIEFQFPLDSYNNRILSSSGRFIPNPSWVPGWVSVAPGQTLIDFTSGGGASGNECGTVDIQPLNNAYAKQSTWLLKLSQALPPNNTFSNLSGPTTTFVAVRNSSYVFSVVQSGSTPIPRLVYNFGGDINSSTNLTVTEKNYHRVGIGIVNKLKK